MIGFKIIKNVNFYQNIFSALIKIIKIYSNTVDFYNNFYFLKYYINIPLENNFYQEAHKFLINEIKSFSNFLFYIRN